MFSVLTVGNSKKSPYYREFVCDIEEDVENLPTGQNQTDVANIDEKNYCAIGSCALILETGDIFVLSNNREWVKI